MSIKMTATEAKAKILSLLDKVAAGEEVEITRHGKTVARLVAAHGPHALKGSLAGVGGDVVGRDSFSGHTAPPRFWPWPRM